MLNLQSPRWSELQHAYGQASDIPSLLELLRDLPKSDSQSEPWFSLWGALAHQGDVYSASFAAIPHVVAALAIDPARADVSFFHFPAWVEVCRMRKTVEVPSDLKDAYFAAMARLPDLVAKAANRPWESGFAACALSAVAAAKGHHAVAEALLEMSTPEVAEDFMTWTLSQ